MVIFGKNQFTIVVSVVNTTETWCDTCNELIDLLACKDENFTQQHRHVLFLLQCMMLTGDQAKALNL